MRLKSLYIWITFGTRNLSAMKCCCEDADEEHVAMPPFGESNAEWADVAAFYRPTMFGSAPSHGKDTTATHSSRNWLEFCSRKAQHRQPVVTSWYTLMPALKVLACDLKITQGLWPCRSVPDFDVSSISKLALQTRGRLIRFGMLHHVAIELNLRSFEVLSAKVVMQCFAALHQGGTRRRPRTDKFGERWSRQETAVPSRASLTGVHPND